MNRKSLFVKLSILFMTAVLGMSVTGCGATGLLENEDGTLPDTASAQDGISDGNGMGLSLIHISEPTRRP